MKSDQRNRYVPEQQQDLSSNQKLRKFVNTVVAPGLEETGFGVFDLVKALAESEYLDPEQRQMAQILLYVAQSEQMQNRECRSLELDGVENGSNSGVMRVIDQSQQQLRQVSSDSLDTRMLRKVNPVDFAPMIEGVLPPVNGANGGHHSSAVYPAAEIGRTGSSVSNQALPSHNMLPRRIGSESSTTIQRPPLKRRLPETRQEEFAEIWVPRSGLPEETVEDIKNRIQILVQPLVVFMMGKNVMTGDDYRGFYQRRDKIQKTFAITYARDRDVVEAILCSFNFTARIPWKKGKTMFDLQGRFSFTEQMNNNAAVVTLEWL